MRTLRERQKQLLQLSVSGVVLLGLFLILLNVAGNWVFVRWDVTRKKVYSLSDSSRKLVRSLDDPLIIKAYFSPDLPPPYNSYARYVRDILMEYRAASKGRVRYEFVSPVPEQAFETHAMEAGLQPLQFEELGSSQMQIKRGFMGMVLFYRDRSDVIPVVKEVRGLEYDLTSRIARMAQKHKKTIAVISGHGEVNWQVPQVKVAADLAEMFELKNVNLPLATTAPLEADALLITGPSTHVDDKSLWQIDQAIMRGMPAAFLVDSKRFMMRQFMAMTQKSGLEDLLSSYGVQIADTLICDKQCATVQMTQNMAGFSFTSSIRYAFIPLITHFDVKDHPVLQGIESVATPFVTPLRSAKLPPGVQFISLLSTSDQSWLAPANSYRVSPTDVPPPGQEGGQGPYTVGALVEGTLPSYFTGKKPPVEGATPILISPKTSVFVLSTSHILDPDLPEFPGSEALISNLLGYLAHDDTLIGIHSKGDILLPLKPISPVSRQIAKVAMILGIPLLPVIWGLGRWRRREAWRREITARFAPAPAATPELEPSAP